MNTNCLVVNLFGVPGAGKSTGATYIFSKLKLAGINAELITEFAKDKVWEENSVIFQPDNQAHIFGKQFYRMNRCKDKVEVIVTDSPLLLSSFLILVKFSVKLLIKWYIIVFVHSTIKRIY